MTRAQLACDIGGRNDTVPPNGNLHLDGEHLWIERGNRRFGYAL